MLKLQSSRPLKLISSLGLALSIAMLGACSSSDPTKVEADFQINSVKGTVSGQNVTIDLTAKEACTDLTNLVADVEAYGATVSPDPKVARDYSQPVKFTVTAPDGTQVIYTVTVKGNSCGYTPPPTPTSCTPAAIGTTGYSLVFKGCDANNVATYYEKTECVRDNSTGLIWQGQTGPGTGLRGNDQYKSNFDSTTALQKWGEGWVEPEQADIDAVANSVGFSKAVNAASLCGKTDWRVPAAEELACLVTGDSAPYIDQVWFPNTPSPSSGYWTSTGIDAFPQAYSPFWVNPAASALFINFDSGNAGSGYRDPAFREGSGKLVRLVRGNASKTCSLAGAA
ncbi:MAG: DUF1566 domain-containing protein [Polaromonas sp.]|nr:DUF1566 domain-containing protein [Polaromonas sp.]